jgi:hypothetical protein
MMATAASLASKRLYGFSARTTIAMVEIRHYGTSSPVKQSFNTPCVRRVISFSSRPFDATFNVWRKRSGPPSRIASRHMNVFSATKMVLEKSVVKVPTMGDSITEVSAFVIVDLERTYFSY